MAAGTVGKELVEEGHMEGRKRERGMEREDRCMVGARRIASREGWWDSRAWDRVWQEAIKGIRRRWGAMGRVQRGRGGIRRSGEVVG